MIVSLLESSSSRNKPPDSCPWLTDSLMTSSMSGSGSARGTLSFIKGFVLL